MSDGDPTTEVIYPSATVDVVPIYETRSVGTQ